jgi:hypothetical protein
MGIATTRSIERVEASIGQLQEVPAVFEAQNGLCQAGVLFALPALISQGLFEYEKVYQPLSKSYYGFQSIVLTLAIMALCRIKNPEQLKQCKVGELGRIIGLDRIPETKNLRAKIQQIVSQQKAIDFNKHLLNGWLGKEECIYFYVDGHVRIYYGSQGQLTSKYVSRQKLCLSATTEYWVNDSSGLPYLVVTGELNEKLQDVIETEIVPKLLETGFIQTRQQQNEEVLLTLIFDREAYQPAFFYRLWTTYRIAVITYRKNVRDMWNENSFEHHHVEVIGNKVDMQLCEQPITLDECPFREVRSLNEGGHQTAIITTHPTISISQIAGQMFSRWSQENFFKYMIADYDFDKMAEFGVESIDENKEVVNPEYRKITYRIKKLKEKVGRLEATFYPLVEDLIAKTIDELPALTAKQNKYQQQIEKLKENIARLKTEREAIPSRIQLKEMPQAKRYNKLKTESKLFLNLIKMICYRAETALAEILQEFFGKASEEKRMLIKQIFNTAADLLPDYDNLTLTVSLYSLSTPRANDAVKELCLLLNQTETIFPGTNLQLIFKTTASLIARDQEV